MSRWQMWWDKLTAPRAADEEQARREYMTKVILVILSAIAACFIPLTLVGYAAGLLPTRYPTLIVGAGVVLGGGWWAAQRGYWRVSSYIPPLVFLLVAMYGQYLSGMGATTVLFYAVVVLLITMLQDNRVQWSAVVFSLGTYVAIGGARAAGYLPPAADPEVGVVARAMTASVAFVSLVLLLWLFTRQFRQTLAKSRTYAAELAKRGDTLEEQVATRTSELRRMAVIDRKAREELEQVVAEYGAFLQQVARGDLRERLAVRADANLGVLGRHLNNMVAGLRELAAQTVAAAHNISAAVSEIQAVVTQQTASTQRQAAAINQTANTALEIKALAEELSTRAQDTAHTARQAQVISQSGLRTIDEMVTSMANVRGRVGEIVEMVVVLSSKVQQANAIVSIVDQIAMQSDMLALNAAIEAARAGEKGQGFEVVAQEVRGLAGRSQTATAQVRGVLQDIQQSIKGLSQVVEMASDSVTRGGELAAQTGEVIAELGARIDVAAQNAQQQLVGVDQQVEGVAQVTMAVGQVNAAMQQMVNSVQQTEHAAQDLDLLAQHMAQVVSQYQLESAFDRV